MTERIHSESAQDCEEVSTEPKAPAEMVDIAEEFIRQAGVDPSKVGYSVNITAVKAEGGSPTMRPSNGWVKKAYAGRDGTEVDIEKELIRTATNVIIRPSRRKRPNRHGGEQETLAFGDAQIPFGDPRAMRLAQTAINELRPDNIVFVGDMIDLPSQSKYEQRPEWAGGVQQSIDELHAFYAQIRSDSPNSNLYVVHGNHEKRMDDYVRRNAVEVLGLRRANMQKELAVLTLEYLLRYDDLGVQAVDGYPNGTLWLEDNLKFVHGTNTKKGGENAAKYLSEEPETTIYGHTHRQELAWKTIPTRNGSYSIAAASPGALCYTDGTVPGFHHTVTAQGELVKKAEDWQQGMLQIHHEGSHHEITPIQFTDRGMRLNGKLYDVDMDDTAVGSTLSAAISLAS